MGALPSPSEYIRLVNSSAAQGHHGDIQIDYVEVLAPVYDQCKVGSPSLGIPMSYWYGAVGAGLLMMAVHSIVNLMQVLATGQPTVRENLVEEESLHLELEHGE